jgi:3-oxoacyl-[acyl-carrier-protein] synthase-3
MKSVGILGLGSCLPPTIRTNEFWQGKLEARDEVQRKGDILALERTSSGERAQLAPEIVAAMASMGDDLFRGAKRRHVIDEASEVSDMEAEAARCAMRDAGVHPSEIDLVLVISMVPDRIMPSNAPAVQAKCECDRATAWSLDVGCASFQPQLQTAAALIRSGAYRRVLVVLSSAASRLLDYTTPMSTGFGDGAAAAVIGEVPDGFGVIAEWMRTDGSLREGVVFAPVIDGAPVRRWDLCSGPTRFATFDTAIGKRAGTEGTRFCREACLAALEAASLRIEDVSLFVCNQSVGWFVDACRRGLGLAADRAIDTFGEVANIGAAVIPFNLERARTRGQLKHGDIVLTYSPGAGFTRASSVMRWFDRATMRG